MSKKKVKGINIYLNNLDKKKLNEIKFTYHLSYSTIINIIWKHLYIWTCRYDQEIRYIYKEEIKNEQRTYIKPRDIKQIPQPTITLTNLTKMFLKDEIEKYIINEKAKKENKENKQIANTLRSQIYNEFRNTLDDNWNGNQLQRQMPKMIKQNRDYYRRLLEMDE